MTSRRLTPVPELDTLLHDLLGHVRTIFGPLFVGMYLDGSLATGDFEPDRSDVDLVVMTAGMLDATTVEALRAMHAALPARAPRWALELEVSYVPSEALRRHDPRPAAHPHVERCSAELALVHMEAGYWVIHRHVLREHGVALDGPAPATLIDPVEPDQLRDAVAGILREWWAPMLTDSRRLEHPLYRCYAVLTMCRMLYTLHHGAIVPKRVAAAWCRESVPDVGALLDRALAWSSETPPDSRETLTLIRRACARASVAPSG